MLQDATHSENPIILQMNAFFSWPDGSFFMCLLLHTTPLCFFSGAGSGFEFGDVIHLPIVILCDGSKRCCRSIAGLISLSILTVRPDGDREIECGGSTRAYIHLI